MFPIGTYFISSFFSDQDSIKMKGSSQYCEQRNNLFQGNCSSFLYSGGKELLDVCKRMAF